MPAADISGYQWDSADPTNAHSYLLPPVLAELSRIALSLPEDRRRLFELGCGNGWVAFRLDQCGWQVTGVDPSTEGIQQANRNFPSLKLTQGSAYDDLANTFGTFPVVLSLEVVEHVYAPRDYARTMFSLLQPGGSAILSTPYHGYLKNLALAITGKMDDHFTALWDHGHIKFWSVRTLTQLLTEAGFTGIRFVRVGRVPSLAKSMIAICQRP